MNASKRLLIFERLSQVNPDPKTELAYSSPFELLIAVMLSAQATDKSVNLATAASSPWPIRRRRCSNSVSKNSLDSFNRLGSTGPRPACHRDLQAAHGPHQGQVPEDRAALESLPGVGRKTPMWCSTPPSAGRPSPWTPTFSGCPNRTKLPLGRPSWRGERPRATRARWLSAGRHHWLILHGRYICKARKPECWHCGIADLCEYKPKTPAPERDDWHPPHDLPAIQGRGAASSS